MNSDTDPELHALFLQAPAEPRADAAQLAVLLQRLDRQDRQRSLLLAGATVLGAALAAGLIVATGVPGWLPTLGFELRQLSLPQPRIEWFNAFGAPGLGLVAVALAALFARAQNSN